MAAGAPAEGTRGHDLARCPTRHLGLTGDGSPGGYYG
ncbi:MAG: hypothetical protein JWO67_6653 [Streptosporangiaceae bacterium]|jgi:hypothetical protein|nr:hypothetical protein [Streptosporangiaceae bacterium]